MIKDRATKEYQVVVCLPGGVGVDSQDRSYGIVDDVDHKSRMHS